MKNWKILLSLAIVLFLLQAHADYLYQASLWKWWTWLDLTSRAPHWPWYADWVPHDAWHIVQTVRNHAALIAAALAYRCAYRVYIGFPAWAMRRLPAMPAQILIMLACYAVTRAVAFTLVYELMN